MRIFLIVVAVLLAMPAVAGAAVVPLGSRTLDQAYEQQACGDEVTIPQGASLGGQTIEAPAKMCSALSPVVFRPVSGTATLSSFRVNSGAYIELRDLTVSNALYLGCNCSASGSPGNTTSNITFQRVKARTFIWRGPDHVKLLNSEIGPALTGDMNWITAPYQSSDPTTDVLIENTRIHDILANDGADHTDCIGIDDVDGLTIRNSRIERCQHFAIIFGGPDSSSGRMARNVLVENTVFDCCTAGSGSNGPGFYALGYGGIGGTHLLRNNTLPGASVGFVGLAQNWTNGLLTFDKNTFQRVNTGGNACGKAIWTQNMFVNGTHNGTVWTAEGCGTVPVTEPEPTPTPTPTPTATPTATPTPTPTPEPYEPACAPTCDEQIVDLKAQVAALEAFRSEYLSWLAQAPE